MSRTLHQPSEKLQALLDDQDHLRATIIIESDRAEADPEKLMEMSRKLALVERAIRDEYKAMREPTDDDPPIVDPIEALRPGNDR